MDNPKYNPFKDNRTEQMQDLWRYYVPFPGITGSRKPLVIEGGRGSGKTMFFQCNSWRQWLLEIRQTDSPIMNLFDKHEFIGIYYRVDTTFVSSMCNKGEDNWHSIFETYLSICILQEVIDFIIETYNEVPVNKNELLSFVKTFSKRFDPHSNIESIVDLQHECNRYLDYIEDKINGLNINNRDGIRWVNSQRIIKDICNTCAKIYEKEILFKIFIDEYETLQNYQQQIVNTLIKHSTIPVVFNIGLRPNGMKTKKTISETETIEEPHDYEKMILGIDDEMSYPQVLKKICQKRIAMAKEQGKIPNSASEDIESYLGQYSIENELASIEKTKCQLPHLKKLEDSIRSIGKLEGIDDTDIDKYVNVLCKEAPTLNSRLHYALLCKKTQYTPSLKQLMEAYKTNSKRYREWMHNRKNGIIFLLCKETKKDKMYYGFDVYTALSSNIVRYFLELCEQAFRIAFLYEFKWDDIIPYDIQTEAARYVSEYKVVDIAGYEPYGNELRIFIQYLGQIFYKLHTDEGTTLGEPEPNHFSTRNLSLDSETKRLISYAIMWNVLQEGEATKKKQSILSPETRDYYINKIYVPYFGISYRNQRKIYLDVDIIKKLFSGKEDIAKNGLRAFFKMEAQNERENGDNSKERIKQLTLYDSFGGQE